MPKTCLEEGVFEQDACRGPVLGLLLEALVDHVAQVARVRLLAV